MFAGGMTARHALAYLSWAPPQDSTSSDSIVLDRYRLAPAHYLAFAKNIDALDMVASFHPQLTMRDEQGRTPLHYYAWRWPASDESDGGGGYRRAWEVLQRTLSKRTLITFRCHDWRDAAGRLPEDYGVNHGDFFASLPSYGMLPSTEPPFFEHGQPPV